MAQRALYCDQAMPDLAWLFVITTSGCVLQGDRLALEVALAPRAQAHVTTQSATKVHEHGRQLRGADADDHARRRRLPRVPARAARSRTGAPASCSDTRISDRPDGDAALFGDRPAGAQASSSGRSASARRVLSIAVDAARPDGRDAVHREAGDRAGAMSGAADRRDGLVRRVRQRDPVHARRTTRTASTTRVDAEVDLANGVAFGACRLPNDAGLIFKVLGRETAQVKAKVREFWAHRARGGHRGRRFPRPFSGADPGRSR